MEYNRYNLKGNVAAKRDILKNLADLFEGNEYKSKLISNNMKEFATTISGLINKYNIRHNNLDSKNKNIILESMTKTELEKLYDNIYDLLLTAFMYANTLDLRKELDEKYLKSLSN
ncbi:MAG: hypothetical protein EOM87_03315 [Clostridia bacterium]|nr:hypothetical protein [Clostridia bacterium]